MRHDETPLQIFTANPSGVPVPVVRPFRRREPTLPFRSQPLSPSGDVCSVPAVPEPPSPNAVPGAIPVEHDPRRALAEAPTWIFETEAVSAAAPSAFDAPPLAHWRNLESAYDRPLRRLWRALLRLLGIEPS